MREIEIRVGRNAAKEIGDWFDRPEKWGRQARKVIYVKSLSMISAIVSSERLRLMKALSEEKGASINKIAKKLKRPREAVSRDLHLLEQKGFVRLERKGKEIKPKIQLEKIVIPIISKK
ncbi:MAG: helix-turn-helix domain-containing protein [Candidatus Diapherotrites archaeon]|uniref:Helix-turn-helix domain-containing protein n=1 Tax=Candidatus Iainarchaeum sp. TaxID=3101447 RepID=A0A7J4KU20_9ARCH|nr:helix-turn-helix domain-containing protein [Candidatus Diapherotrites archaeon]HIH21820.1 helix-turn-helix domain-containing protein [Candidatus Diapherotrites archaeon]HIH33308.1 helix-turn-helix domain-containing protein [Candidatus Diapherotrites archaeon]